MRPLRLRSSPRGRVVGFHKLAARRISAFRNRDDGRFLGRRLVRTNSRIKRAFSVALKLGLLGGVHEQFDTPGGGLLNFDTLLPAIELPDSELVILLGEASFHQIHGGIATNSSIESFLPKLTQWSDEKTVIRKQPYELPRPRKRPTYLGVLPQQMLSRFTFAAAAQSHPRLSEPPLDRIRPRALVAYTPRTPNRSRCRPPCRDRSKGISDRSVRQRRCGCAIGSTTRSRRARTAASAFSGGRSIARSTVNADYQMARADAHRVLGDKDVAISHYQRALYFNNNLVQAHIGLATLRFPGEYYLACRERLYSVLAPETLIDIGVFHGDLLSPSDATHARDRRGPATEIHLRAQEVTHIFVETSDAFFERRGLDLPPLHDPYQLVSPTVCISMSKRSGIS